MYQQKETDHPETTVGWRGLAEVSVAPVEVAEGARRGCTQRGDVDDGRDNENEVLVALRERVAQLEREAAVTEREADIQAAEQKDLRMRFIALQGEMAATKRSAARQEKAVVATIHAITKVTESFREAPLTPNLVNRAVCFGEEVAQTLERTRNLGIISTE